jgi:hypothetical protein
MKNNRWCSNVERAHKSNGIYYVGGSAGCSSMMAFFAHIPSLALQSLNKFSQQKIFYFRKETNKNCIVTRTDSTGPGAPGPGAFEKQHLNVMLDQERPA